jgi:hypothetical protein
MKQKIHTEMWPKFFIHRYIFQFISTSKYILLNINLIFLNYLYMFGSKNKNIQNMKTKLINLNKIIQSQIKSAIVCCSYCFYFLFLFFLLLFWFNYSVAYCDIWFKIMVIVLDYEKKSFIAFSCCYYGSWFRILSIYRNCWGNNPFYSQR